MRLLHYHPRAAIGDGGISRSLRALSRELAARGVHVTIAYDEPGHYPQPTDGIRWLRVRHVGPSRLRLPLDLASPVRESDLVVLHSAWTAHNARTAAVARAEDIPYVIAPRGAYDPAIRRRRRLLKAAWRLTIEHRVVSGARAAHVFFASQEPHLRDMGFSGPLVVAPNGVDVDPDIRWDGGSGGHLLYLGRYDPEHKGLDLLMHALAELPPVERPRLRMHGSDWQGGEDRLRGLVSDLELGSWVDVGGHVTGAEKWRTMVTARGLVYPSRWEAFGNSVAEAAAAGVPVLTTPYPLGRYLAERDAALVVSTSVRALAEGLRRLADDDLRAMGQRAAQVAREELSWPAVAGRWHVQLEELA